LFIKPFTSPGAGFHYMDSIPSFLRPQFSGGIIFFLFVSLLCCLGIDGDCSSAYAADQVTFSWRANPQSDDVVGYRLYLGSASRFDGSGFVKQDFSYASYLDFTDSQRCVLTDSDPVCETYSVAEVDCEGIYGETPSCTLYNLEGQYYFAMTAYNAQAESDYTAELSGFFYISEEPVSEEPVFSSDDHSGGSLVLSEVMATLQQVYLLLRK